MSERDLLGADGDILVCAFRYALGRQSYIVDTVASFVDRNADRLEPATRALIVREIEQANQRRALGMDCDERRWKRTRDWLKAIESYRGGGSPPSGEHEQAHRAFMRRTLEASRSSAGGVPSVRCGLGDAAHLADAIGRDVLAEHVGSRGKATKLGEQLAAVATRIGNAIWAARQETYKAKAEGAPDA